MNTISLDLEDDIAALLQATNQPVHQAAREFIILELYRRGTISSGKAAELLHMLRWEFVRYASRLGIAFFDMTSDEWQTEQLQARSLWQPKLLSQMLARLLRWSKLDNSSCWGSFLVQW